MNRLNSILSWFLEYLTPSIPMRRYFSYSLLLKQLLYLPSLDQKLREVLNREISSLLIFLFFIWRGCLTSLILEWLGNSGILLELVRRVMLFPTSYLLMMCFYSCRLLRVRLGFSRIRFESFVALQVSK